MASPLTFANITASGDHDFYVQLADVAAQQRDLTGLRQYAPRAEALAAGWGHSLYLAIAHRAWGVAHRLAGEWPAAQARLDQALALFQSLEARWQIALTWFELGELAHAQGQPARAREHFTLALHAFDALRAAPAAARARAALAGLPAPG